MRWIMPYKTLILFCWLERDPQSFLAFLKSITLCKIRSKESETGVDGPLALVPIVWNTEESVNSVLANGILTPYVLSNGLLMHLMT